MVAHTAEDRGVTVQLCPAPSILRASSSGRTRDFQSHNEGSTPFARLRDCGSTEEHDVAIVETRVRLPPVAPVRVVKLADAQA